MATEAGGTGATAVARSRMSPERQAELFATVVELIREVGYEGLTLDAVATRAKTSKATLYRQWGGKAGLVVAALKAKRPEHPSERVGRSLAEDFSLMVAGARSMRGGDSSLMYGLMHAMTTDAEFADAARAAFVEPAADGLAGVFRRAVERGEIADRPELFQELARTVLSRALFHKLFAPAELGSALRSHFDLIVAPALRAETDTSSDHSR